jgi:hypothetical protein
MDLRRGQVHGGLPRRSGVGYVVGYVVFIAAMGAGFIRVAQGHRPGLIVVVPLVAASILVVAIGFSDIRAGRVEPPRGFVEALRRLRRG